MLINRQVRAFAWSKTITIQIINYGRPKEQDQRYPHIFSVLIVKPAGKDISENNENQRYIDNQSDQGDWKEKMKLTKFGKIYQA
jgi:hypothetical protein